MVSNSAPKFDIGTKMDKESACFMMVQADVERNKWFYWRMIMDEAAALNNCIDLDL